MSKVGIIIPLYKQAEYLNDCIDSVLDQTYENWECVIVNDAGTDDDYNESIRQTYRDHRIRVIHHTENKGLSGSRNTGLFAHNSEYILPLDADDTLHPECLDSMVNAIEAGLGDIIYCDRQDFGVRNGYVSASDYNYASLKQANCMSCCSLYRRLDAISVGGYRECLKLGFEDWMLWLEMGFIGFKGYCIHKPLFNYRQKTYSMSDITHANWDKALGQIHALRSDIFN